MANLARFALLGVALASLSSASPVRNTREAGQEGCGQGCQLLGDDSDFLSRCVKYACRKHVFRYYMRVGKRMGSISSDPAFRHRLLQRHRQKQRQWQRLTSGQPQIRLQQWHPQMDKGQQLPDKGQVLEGLTPNRRESSPLRRNSFHAMNFNNLYRNTNNVMPRSRRWRKVVVVPMTSSEQLGIRMRRRLPLFLRRLNVRDI